MMKAVDLPVLGLSGEFWVDPRYLYPKYSRGTISLHQPEDFKQMDKSCLHLGQNLPKFLVRCEANIQSHAEWG